jgi:hypothetical protein
MCGNEERAVCAFTDSPSSLSCSVSFFDTLFRSFQKNDSDAGKNCADRRGLESDSPRGGGNTRDKCPSGETSRIDRNSSRMTGLLINPAPSLADRRPEVVLPPFQDTVYLFGLTVVGGAEMPSSSCYGLRRPL